MKLSSHNGARDMEFKVIVDAKARATSGCAVVGVYENGELGAATRHLDAQLGGLITRLHSAGDFGAKLGDALLLPHPQGVLRLGLGTRAGFGRKQYRKALTTSAQAVLKTGSADVIVYLALEDVSGMETVYRARAVAEVFSAQMYKIPDLKTAPKPKAPKLASLIVAADNARSAKAMTSGLKVGAAIGAGSALARDLANLPPNVCTPTYLGERALALSAE